MQSLQSLRGQSAALQSVQSLCGQESVQSVQSLRGEEPLQSLQPLRSELAPLRVNFVCRGAGASAAFRSLPLPWSVAARPFFSNQRADLRVRRSGRIRARFHL